MTTMIDANVLDDPDAGGTFTADGREFVIIGWFTASGFVHELFTYEPRKDDSDALWFVQRWVEGAPYRYELTDDSGWTVIDLVHRGWLSAPALERSPESLTVQCAAANPNAGGRCQREATTTVNGHHVCSHHEAWAADRG